MTNGRSIDYIQEYKKGSDEEEYALPLIRESGCLSGAERPLEGRNAEGSFQAGEPRASVEMREVSSHELSPLPDMALELAGE